MTIIPRITPADYLKASRLKLKQRGFVYPATTVAEARRAGLRLDLACALLLQESHGGHNIYGHDPVSSAPRGALVTKTNYLEYKKRRGPAGLGGMQGVGPCQLTWWAFQDEADAQGGCWLPWINMRVGFTHLVRAIARSGLTFDGLRQYNGTGVGAEKYAHQVIDRAAALRTAGIS